MTWFSEKPEGLQLHCQIQPRASKTEIVGPHGDPPRLKIRIAAPPVDGEANEELIFYLSKRLKVPKGNIQLVSGHTGKFKEVLIVKLSIAKFREIFDFT